MIRKKDYYKLGSFIVVGTFLLVAMIIILGAGRFFRTSFKMESYFNESINGLEVGSPVKLRGVMIGRVAHINFVANKYEGADLYEARQVLVECDIYPDTFRDMSESDFRRAIALESDRGLRVRPTSLGLTGQLFLNLEYIDLEEYPSMLIQWEPEEAYIPSVPSTLNQLERAIATISNTLSGIKQEDLQSIIDDFRSIMDSVEGILSTKGGKEGAQRLLDILTGVDTMLKRVNLVIADPALETLIPNAAGAMAGINTIISESSDDIIKTAAEASQAMTSLKKATDVLGKTIDDPRTQDALSEIAPMLENIAKASEDLSAAVAKVHNLTNRVNGLLASEEANINAIMQDTREVMENLRELTGDAKRYPSGILFGQPPSKANPTPKKTE